MGSVIEAIEYVYPEKRVTNKDLQKKFPLYDFEKFEKKVGIHSRFIVEEETALDLAVKAAQKLFEKRIDKNEIDYILYCTQSPEYILPTTACILQHKLSLRKDIGALDFNLGCSGYTYGISLAKALIESNQAKKILLVTAETYSKFIHEDDRTNRSIFGDAATATIISFSENNCIGDFLTGTDGAGFDKLIVRNGGGKNPKDINSEVKCYGTGNKYTDNHLYMNGPDVFNFTSDTIPNFANEILIKNHLDKDSVDQFIFHQANAFMLNFIRRKIKISKDKFFIDLKEGGNTVSCTIPIALKEYSKTIKTEQKLMLVGFGVGLSWSGGVITINKPL
ncbi:MULTISPECIES: 3-oxoacyl-ACP synthase III family protein [Tenacibaculum]|uniref:3-oxoacyl-ACP synthase III family protein n=1 Tax=Tenacibaculum TaxID=104267 RepID=UPI001EFB4551|nr:MULTISPECIES: ketoacyl-ACP synthase III [Tenacibaculum]MCG8236939.1 ketoacyl-ACP synthase III [Tenacibaculum finnmarkense genomovar ulcerans]MCG8831029.1 ketoacyl-ACP synthase III [Tenacibaculum finnmarkense]